MKEKSIFVEVFGESPFIRVLDFLLTFDEFDYSIKHIARETNTGWKTVEDVIKKLIKRGIVRKTRQVGKADMYALDRESPITKILLKIDLELTKAGIKKELEKQNIPA